MKDCVQWNPVYYWKDLPQAGFGPGIARSVGQYLTEYNSKCYKVGHNVTAHIHYLIRLMFAGCQTG